jgi:FtsP/CotA-like multicopper oxidase with cupredoxin domain
MHRRQFLGTAAAVAGAALTPTGARGDGLRRLAMPPLRDTRATGRLALTARPGTARFLGRAESVTAGFDQDYLGPTVVMRDGPLGVTVDNALGETLTVHWHGLLVPGEHDGGPHSAIAPGGRWTVDMHLAQRPATVWYHSHTHGATARHVYFGLAGVIHQTDGRDDDRGLPNRYGIDDLTLVVQDRRFDADGRMVYAPEPTDILNGFEAGRVLVNGQADAVAVVPPGVVRLRFVNGSNARFYSLHFDDGRPMHLVATDGGFLPRPRALEFLRLAPGERAEVLVDFAAGGTTPTLLSSRGGRMRVLPFAVDGREPVRIVRVPDRLDVDPLPDDMPEARLRRFSLTMGGGSSGQSRGTAPPPLPHAAQPHAHHGHSGHGGGGHGAIVGGGPEAIGTRMNDFAINGRPHDMRRIDFEVPLGTTERWIVTGGGGVEHPFHVHGVHFRVMRIGGIPPRAEESGWKDTVGLAGETELLVRFDHRAGADAPYMYHCHILEHEDAGMMGQFTVV